jgi:ABC-type polysaccharide/polyol phosphate export permease
MFNSPLAHLFHDILRFVFGFGFSFAAIYSIRLFAANTSGTEHRQRVIGLLWLVVPPLTFWIEYYLFAPNLVTANQTQLPNLERELARFKDFREASIPIWVAVSSALGALYLRPLNQNPG